KPSFSEQDKILRKLAPGKTSAEIPSENDKDTILYTVPFGNTRADGKIRDRALFDSIAWLAAAAARTTGISFASVDTVIAGGKPYVMEINSGVMLEHFAAASDENYKKAESIYAEALSCVFP
ncbi:MAG: hypothetical protein LBC13_04090, partial [Clostridiales bacterium]|nr:hypothetical protein [Clostridiales bacterium]